MDTKTTETSVLDDADEDFVIDAPGCVIRVKAAKNVTVIACGDLNCNGATIGGKLNCCGATIDGTLDCCGATIDGNLDCYGVTIDGDLDCRNATIGGNLDCYGATIDGTLDCRNATIGVTLYCTGAKIGGDLYCRNATIDGIKIANPTEEELLLIREIYARISDVPCRLKMTSWHCGTSHCLAGWCQVLRDNLAEDNYALVAGQKYLPSLSYLFFSTDAIVIKKLKELCE